MEPGNRAPELTELPCSRSRPASAWITFQAELKMIFNFILTRSGWTFDNQDQIGLDYTGKRIIRSGVKRGDGGEAPVSSRSWRHDGHLWTGEILGSTES